MKKALVIQTAHLGDVILSTAVVEKLHRSFEGIEIDFLLKKGNESVLANHPKLRRIYCFDKNSKWNSFWELQSEIKKEKYDLVVNLQRFFTSGLLSILSGAETVIGFDKNPLSFFYHKKYAHRFEPDSMLHEVERNLILVSEITDDDWVSPKLYPSAGDYDKTEREDPYICIAPASKWFTKQWPAENWIKALKHSPPGMDVLLIGSEGDRALCDQIESADTSGAVKNTAGQYSLLEVAALMDRARMNFTNDSAPLHIASAMNAPVTALFCSTIPGFGFYPLSEDSLVLETGRKLSCRPCGLHGRKKCPEQHFNCTDISIKAVVDRMSR